MSHTRSSFLSWIMGDNSANRSGRAARERHDDSNSNSNEHRTRPTSCDLDERHHHHRHHHVHGIKKDGTSSQALPWWHRGGIPHHWIGREAELGKFIAKIVHTNDHRAFKVDVPAEFSFSLQDETSREMITDALREDKNLVSCRNQLVPSVMTEEEFWRRYFYNVHVIKSTSDIQQRDTELAQELKSEIVSVEPMVVKLTDLLQREIERMMRKQMRQSKSEDEEDDDDDREGEGEEEEGHQKGEAAKDENNDGDEEADRVREEEIETLFRSVIEKKKKISMLVVECHDEELILKAQSINGHFHKMLREHRNYDILKGKERERKILRMNTFDPKLLNSTRDPPSVTTPAQRRRLCSALPRCAQRWNWKLLYSTREHGTSINTFYQAATSCSLPTIFIVQTVKDTIFGAFNNGEWEISSRRYYGDGENFLFTFKNNQFKAFRWSKKNRYFILSSQSSIAFGGGMDGKAGLHIDGEFLHGSSQRCETFDNEPLAEAGEGYDEGDFDIHTIEVWTFEDMDDKRESIRQQMSDEALIQQFRKKR